MNSMKTSPEKFRLMILSQKLHELQKLFMNTFTADESDVTKLQGMTIVKVLNFIRHIERLCCNAQYTLQPLR